MSSLAQSQSSRLVAFGQSLSTNKGPCHMEGPFVCILHGANLIINILSLRPFGPLAISNENIRRCPRCQWTHPNNVAKTINGNFYLITYTQPACVGLKKTSHKMLPFEAMTMLST